MTAKLWDTSCGQETLTLKDSSFVYSVAFSPDGSQLVIGGSAGLKLFDAAPKEDSKPIRVVDCTRALDQGKNDWSLWRGRGLAYAALGQWESPSGR
jgi:WD40 repeat protein